jgi:hypothetical protein
MPARSADQHARKRGGEFHRTTLGVIAVDSVTEFGELPRKSEAPDLLAEVTNRKLQRQWQKARIYLSQSLGIQVSLS